MCNDGAPNAPWDIFPRCSGNAQIEENEDEDTKLAVGHVTLWAQAGWQLAQSAQRGITF